MSKVFNDNEICIPVIPLHPDEIESHKKHNRKLFSEIEEVYEKQRSEYVSTDEMILIRLIAMERLTYRELGIVFGCSAASITRKYNEAVRKLKEKFVSTCVMFNQ